MVHILPKKKTRRVSKLFLNDKATVYDFITGLSTSLKIKYDQCVHVMERMVHERFITIQKNYLLLLMDRHTQSGGAVVIVRKKSFLIFKEKCKIQT